MNDFVGGYRLPSLTTYEGCARAMNEDVPRLSRAALFGERERLQAALGRTLDKPREFNRLIATPRGPVPFPDWANARIYRINAELSRR